MKSICTDINRHIGIQASIIHNIVNNKYPHKTFKIVKLRREGKLGNVRGDDFIHPAVIHFRGMANRVS